MADILPFPEFRPDVSSYLVAGSQTISNVVPRADGYGPFAALTPFSAAIASGNDSFTKVLLHFDGADAATAIADHNAGGSAHAWTANGNAQIDTALSKFGGASLLLDGAGDYVSTPDHPDFTLGAGDWTIDCWFNCTAAGGTNQLLAGQNDAALTATTRSFGIGRNTSNFMTASAHVGATSVILTGTTQFTNAVNTGWHHLALVRTGNTLKLFIDGIQEASAAITGTINDSSNNLTVGRFGELAGQEWTGWIDEFRMSVGVARWTANFTPPVTAYNISQTCRGFFYAIKSDGSIAVFAGTATKIYQLDNTTLAFADCSKALGAYSPVPPSDHWQFAQFGDRVIAVQANTVPQVFNLASSAEFADLAGGPPPARYIAIVGRFVVLSGLLSTPFRIQWSGLGVIDTWTAGVFSSDFQDLPDGGVVRGVGGGEYGAIFQDTAIRRMVFVGGPIVFQIERVTQDKGLYAPYSLIRAADMIFFIAAQGLQALGASGVPVPIGKEKFDRTFFANHDASALQYVIGAADPKETRVYWSYRSAGGAAAGFDHLLCYDYALGRATVIAAAGEYIATLSRPGFTLESMDAISGSLDALTFSLDEVSVAASATLSAVSLGHQLGFFTGANLEATLETSEQSVPGRRGRLKGFRPVTDAAACYGAIGARETLQEQAIAYSAEQAVNGRGLCPANVSTRLARARLRIPAGTSWTFATGVEPEFKPEGKR